MKNTIGAHFLMAIVAVGAAGGCRKKEGGDPRCRIFEQDPAGAEQGTLAELEAAYRNVEMISECARAAGMTVEEWNRRYKVAERARWISDTLGAAGRTILDEARGTIRQVEESATRALEQGMKRADEALKTIDESAGR
ncbi:MAG: hypothetical protein QME96_03425 [Myxococcota bacterium]|nr:hypothetical protein [Myxococcota bacterium]